MARKDYDPEEYLGPANVPLDITPSANELEEPTRFIMVSADDITVTGLLNGTETSHTTFGLKAGVVYPFAFKTITAVSGGGTVKGYY